MTMKLPMTRSSMTHQYCPVRGFTIIATMASPDHSVESRRTTPASTAVISRSDPMMNRSRISKALICALLLSTTVTVSLGKEPVGKVKNILLIMSDDRDGRAQY